MSFVSAQCLIFLYRAWYKIGCYIGPCYKESRLYFLGIAQYSCMVKASLWKWWRPPFMKVCKTVCPGYSGFSTRRFNICAVDAPISPDLAVCRSFRNIASANHCSFGGFSSVITRYWLLIGVRLVSLLASVWCTSHNVTLMFVFDSGVLNREEIMVHGFG